VHDFGVSGIVVGMRDRESLEWSAAETAGDAFEALFRTEAQAMHRLAFAMLGSDADAEQVVQEAFLGVASRWDGLDNAGGYLRVSVVNGCRKVMRSQTRRTRAEAAMGVELTGGQTGEVDYLLDALDELTERQRTAVVLTYYSGLNSNEVGMLMGCRPGTVRSLVRHALKALRRTVER